MPIYMQYDGIKGSVTEAGHKEWIELQSCQMGTHRNVTSAVGGSSNREASAPSISEIVITKNLDAASAELFRASLVGEGKKVKIDFCKTDKDKLTPYLQLELENTLVSSFSLSGHGGSGNSAPMESLSINFTKISLNHLSPDESNAKTKPIRAGYDLSAAKPV
ncbi:MAG: type VI secretion system tube protein Hcp [Planctomycetes bacterium]|nr:type VI secretion system tube protein Hcp [Planctomycetota bacterium]